VPKSLFHTIIVYSGHPVELGLRRKPKCCGEGTQPALKAKLHTSGCNLQSPGSFVN